MMDEGVLDIGLSVFLAFYFFLHGEALARLLHITLEHLAGSRAAYLLAVGYSLAIEWTTLDKVAESSTNGQE